MGQEAKLPLCLCKERGKDNDESKERKTGVYPASCKSSVLSITGEKITFASTTFLYPHEKCDLLRSFTMIYCLSNLNAEFQRIARRHKKAFLSDQCKGREENNRMGKTRDLFKEKAMAPHSSTLAWPWTEEPGRLKSMGSLRVRHD